MEGELRQEFARGTVQLPGEFAPDEVSEVRDSDRRPCVCEVRHEDAILEALAKETKLGGLRDEGGERRWERRLCDLE